MEEQEDLSLETGSGLPGGGIRDHSAPACAVLITMLKHL